MWWVWSFVWAASPGWDFTDVEVRGELARPDVTYVMATDRPFAAWGRPRVERRLARLGDEHDVERAFLWSRLADLDELAYLESLDERSYEAPPGSIAVYRRQAWSLLAASPAEDPLHLLRQAQLAEVLGEDDVGPLEQLLARFPEHPDAARAALELGQQAFTEADLPRAHERFARASDAADPDIRSFARYMLGWCAFNRGDAAEARTLWGEVASQGASAHLRAAAEADLARLEAPSVEP